MGLSVPGFFRKQASQNPDRATTALPTSTATPSALAIFRQTKLSRLSLENLHRFHQASRHTIEGLRQLRDLIIT